MKKPKIYFFLSVWGEKYTDFFLELCLSSLLSKDNLKILKPNDNRFLIACPEKEWNKISKHPNVILARKYIKFDHLYLKDIKKSESPIKKMGEGHILATEICFKNGALGVALTPDLILSDSIVKTILENYKNKIEILLLPALRFEEESIFQNLKKEGYLEKKKKRFFLKPINAQQLSKIAIKSFHFETDYYRYENKFINKNCIMPALIFELPNQNGFIFKCMSWLPIYIDYSKIVNHDVSTIRDWSIDGDYIYKNFRSNTRIRVINESIEGIVVSWSKKNENIKNFRSKKYLYNNSFISKILKTSFFRFNARGKIFDNIKRNLLDQNNFFIDKKLKKTKEFYDIEYKCNEKANLKKNIIFDLIINYIFFNFFSSLSLFTSRLKVLFSCIILFNSIHCQTIINSLKRRKIL